MDSAAAHYLKAFERAQALPFDSDHIDAFPRHGLTRVYVFSPTYNADVLRKKLEKTIGVIPRLSEGTARSPVLYVLDSEAPKGFGEVYRQNVMADESLQDSPEKRRELIDGFLSQTLPNVHTSAVFIRAATNPYVKGEAVKSSGDRLSKAFKSMEERISWRFAEARQLMKTRDILRSCDPRLADAEFRGSIDDETNPFSGMLSL